MYGFCDEGVWNVCCRVYGGQFGNGSWEVGGIDDGGTLLDGILL